jgi:hypothetical protein
MSKNQKNSSNDMFDFQELGQQYQDSAQKIRLEKYEKDIIELKSQIETLVEQLNEKNQEISNLKDVLKGTIPSYIPIVNAEVSDEEEIALKQLERLKEAAKIRHLSLEEVRIYDLLVKNKRLAQGNSTNIVDTVKLPKEKSKLIQIASKKIDEPTEE